MSYRVIFLLIVIFVIGAFLFSKPLLAEEGKPFVYDSKGKRDPFVPLIRGEIKTYSNLENIESVKDLILEGIVWDQGGDSIVVLNGVILKEGDIINNIQVLKIRSEKVLLKIGEQKYEMNLEKKEE